MKKVCLIIPVFAFAFGGCKKDTDTAKDSALTAHAWYLNRFYVDDSETLLEPCQLDDSTLYGTNGTFIIDHAVICSPSQLSKDVGTYILSSDEKVLTCTAGFPSTTTTWTRRWR